MRATTAFNKMLAIPGAHVAAVTFTPGGIVVDLARRAKRLRCPCGWSTRAVYDRSTTVVAGAGSRRQQADPPRRDPPPLVPALRPGPHRRRALGPAGCPVHP